MSRSYKHTPGLYPESGGNRLDKRLAAKAVRHAAEVPDGGAYKKLYESYSIVDIKYPLFGAGWAKYYPTWRLVRK